MVRRVWCHYRSGWVEVPDMQLWGYESLLVRGGRVEVRLLAQATEAKLGAEDRMQQRLQCRMLDMA